MHQPTAMIRVLSGGPGPAGRPGLNSCGLPRTKCLAHRNQPRMERNESQSQPKTLLVAAAATLLAGCSQAVTIDTTFPRPVIDALPLKAGVRYGPEFSDYRYVEALPQYGEWTFDLGGANRKLFEILFSALFAETVAVPSIESAAQAHPDLDVVIEPAVEALEFALPSQSRSDQYSVWIRYNLAIYEPTGDLITNWPVSAYGESDSRTFGASKSMKQATIRAMRDAAAIIALGFAGQPKVRQALLNENDDNDDNDEAGDETE